MFRIRSSVDRPARPLTGMRLDRMIRPMGKRLFDSLTVGLVVGGIAWLVTGNGGTALVGFLFAFGPLLAGAFRAYWRAMAEAEREERRP